MIINILSTIISKIAIKFHSHSTFRKSLDFPDDSAEIYQNFSPRFHQAEIAYVTAPEKTPRRRSPLRRALRLRRFISLHTMILPCRTVIMRESLEVVPPHHWFTPSPSLERGKRNALISAATLLSRLRYVTISPPQIGLMHVRRF